MSCRDAIAMQNSGFRAASTDQVVHELKCWPQFFRAIQSEEKTHDLRRTDDREFKVGDKLFLREFDPKTGTYTGRSLMVKVTYVTSSKIPCALSEAALHPSYCILSIKIISKDV